MDRSVVRTRRVVDNAYQAITARAFSIKACRDEALAPSETRSGAGRTELKLRPYISNSLTPSPSLLLLPRDRYAEGRIDGGSTMSKLADAIKRNQRTESTPMGFGAARPATKPSMLVGFLGAAGDVVKARDAGADLLIVDARPSGGLSKLLGASNELPADAFKVDTTQVQSPAGAFADPDAGGAKALKDKGFDFIVFEPENTPAGALLDEDMGYVLALPASAEDPALRAFASLQLDAVF